MKLFAKLKIGLVATLVGATVVATASGAVSMKAISIEAFGAPDVLELREVPRPQPGPGEVLVRIRAAGVNPIDAFYRQRGEALGFALPFVPGADLSGEVAVAGEGVTAFSPGDAVFGMIDLDRGGAYAEYAVVKVEELAPKPARLSHVEAAALPLVAQTAWLALFELAELQPGQTVLIHAGAGGFGSTAVQLAKWKGANVIATASAANHEFLRGLGADRVIDYRSERFEEVVSNVDVVLDPVAGDTQVRSLGVLKPGGTLIALKSLTPEAEGPAAAHVRVKGIHVMPDPARLRRLGELIDAGHLRPVVTHVLPLARAAEAHVQSETGHTRGKIVLTVDER